MEAPVLVKPIPPQLVNVQGAFGPLNLRDFIQVPAGSPVPRFIAELSNGNPLPQGVICTSDGIMTGIPSKGTEGVYDVVIHAINDGGELKAGFSFTVKPNLTRDATYVDKMKAQVWEALGQHLPIPDMGDLYDLPISILDIDHVMERWGTLKIWDAFNLSPPGPVQLITIEGMSEHYHVADRGSCLIAFPKDLFSHERTLEDGLQTARALAREVYKRDWTIEMVGLDKFTRAAWIEIQHLGDQFGKRLEVINFSPSTNEINLYATQAIEKGMRRKSE